MRALLRQHAWVIGGLAIAMAVVLFLAPLASSDPDGLDRVAQDQQFADEGKSPGYTLLPDYSIPGIEDDRVSVILAGLMGVTIVFALPVTLTYVARRRRGSPRP